MEQWAPACRVSKSVETGETEKVSLVLEIQGVQWVEL